MALWVVFPQSRESDPLIVTKMPAKSAAMSE